MSSDRLAALTDKERIFAEVCGITSFLARVSSRKLILPMSSSKIADSTNAKSSSVGDKTDAGKKTK